MLDLDQAVATMNRVWRAIDELLGEVRAHAAALGTEHALAVDHDALSRAERAADLARHAGAIERFGADLRESLVADGRDDALDSEQRQQLANLLADGSLVYLFHSLRYHADAPGTP